MPVTSDVDCTENILEQAVKSGCEGVRKIHIYAKIISCYHCLNQDDDDNREDKGKSFER